MPFVLAAVILYALLAKPAVPKASVPPPGMGNTQIPIGGPASSAIAQGVAAMGLAISPSLLPAPLYGPVGTPSTGPKDLPVYGPPAPYDPFGSPAVVNPSDRILGI